MRCIVCRHNGRSAIAGFYVGFFVGVSDVVNAAHKICEMHFVGGGELARFLPEAVVLAAIKGEHDKLWRRGWLFLGAGGQVRLNGGGTRKCQSH
jgi:hypothetical protein